MCRALLSPAFPGWPTFLKYMAVSPLADKSSRAHTYCVPHREQVLIERTVQCSVDQGEQHMLKTRSSALKVKF